MGLRDTKVLKHNLWGIYTSWHDFILLQVDYILDKNSKAPKLLIVITIPSIYFVSHNYVSLFHQFPDRIEIELYYHCNASILLSTEIAQW